MTWTKGPLTIKRDAGNGQYRVHTSKTRYSIAHFDTEDDARLFAHAAELAEAAEQVASLMDKDDGDYSDGEQIPLGHPFFDGFLTFGILRRLAVALKAAKEE